MLMEIREATHEGEWNRFVETHGPRSGAFLHSWAWGQFQRSVGREVARLALYDGDEQAGAANVLIHRVPPGFRYAFCPRGPIVAPKERFKEAVRVLSEALRARCLFVRLEPPLEGTEFVSAGALASKDIEPKETLILDISRGPEEILKNMHPKTRYNIKLAGRHGVTCDFSGQASVTDVWPLFLATARRDRIRLHAKEYYEKMLATVQGQGLRTFIATSSYRGKFVAAAIMVDFAGVRTYVHGASSDEHRGVMAPHALHWSLIEDAQAEGLLWYDWFGITTSLDPKHSWAGITRFKRGFGGATVIYPGTFDLVLKPGTYAMYEKARGLARAARRLLR